MYNTHPTLIDQNSNFYNESAKLAYIYHDLIVKLTALINQSVSELGNLGVGNCRRGNATGRAEESHADAGFFRESGRIIQQLIQFCECGFRISIKNESAPSSEPDAGERRVPYCSGTVGRTITGRTRASTALARTRPRWILIMMG